MESPRGRTSRLPTSLAPSGDDATRPFDAAEGAFQDRVRATSQLVAGILHEFNTPLGALRSSVDTARGAIARLRHMIETDPARAARLCAQLDEVLAVSRVAADRIVDTVEALAHFARVDRADVDEVDVGQMVETALRLAGAARNRSLEIVRRVPKDVRVRCRVREVEHVLYHIIRNANEVLAGRPDARLEVRVERAGDTVGIEVRDNGPGIDPDELPTLFEPSLTTKGSTVGLGLSLATCRYIAQEHGGDLEAENPPDGGARFTFRFREEPAVP